MDALSTLHMQLLYLQFRRVQCQVLDVGSWELSRIQKNSCPHSHTFRRTCDSTPHFGHFFLVQVDGLGILASRFRSTFSSSVRAESA